MEENVKDDKIRVEDEIDLFELFLVLKKRFKLMLLIFALSIFIAVLVSLLMKPAYRASFIIRVPEFQEMDNEFNVLMSRPIISPKETERIINELKKLKDEDRVKELSEMLSLNENIVDDLDSFSAEEPEKRENFVEVSIDVYDPSIIHDIKNGILRYLNKNSYVNERVSLERESLAHLKDELQKKIEGMDGLKNIVVYNIKKDRVNDLGFNPIELDKEIIVLKQKLKEVENDILLLRGFEIAVEPIIPQNPVKPNKKLLIAVTGIISLFFGIFLTFFMEWIEVSKKKDRKDI